MDTHENYPWWIGQLPQNLMGMGEGTGTLVPSCPIPPAHARAHTIYTILTVKVITY